MIYLDLIEGEAFESLLRYAAGAGSVATVTVDPEPGTRSLNDRGLRLLSVGHVSAGAANDELTLPLNEETVQALVAASQSATGFIDPDLPSHLRIVSSAGECWFEADGDEWHIGLYLDPLDAAQFLRACPEIDESRLRDSDPFAELEPMLFLDDMSECETDALRYQLLQRTLTPSAGAGEHVHPLTLLVACGLVLDRSGGTLGDLLIRRSGLTAGGIEFDGPLQESARAHIRALTSELDTLIDGEHASRAREILNLLGEK